MTKAPADNTKSPATCSARSRPGWVTVGVLMVGLLSGCAVRKPVHTQVIYPHQCITSDIVCTPHGNGKKMDCKFDKLKSCAVIKVIQ